MLTLILNCANVLLVINKLSSEPNKCCINVSMDATLLLLLFCLALTASPVHLVSVFDVIIDQCLPHAKFYYISLEEAGQQEDDLSVSRILESSARFRSRFVRFTKGWYKTFFVYGLSQPTNSYLPVSTYLPNYRPIYLPMFPVTFVYLPMPALLPMSTYQPLPIPIHLYIII